LFGQWLLQFSDPFRASLAGMAGSAGWANLAGLAGLSALARLAKLANLVAWRACPLCTHPNIPEDFEMIEN